MKYPILTLNSEIRVNVYQVNFDDSSQDFRMEPLSDFALGEVEEAGRGRHLDVEHRLVALGRCQNELKIKNKS